MSKRMKNMILVADGDPVIRDNLKDYLTRIGFEVEDPDSGAKVLSQLAINDYSILLLDDKIPGFDDLDLLGKLIESHPRLGIIMMTGSPSVDSIITAMRRGVCDYVVKPYDSSELTAAVKRVSKRCSVIREGCSNSKGVMGMIADTLPVGQNLNADSRSHDVDHSKNYCFETQKGGTC